MKNKLMREEVKQCLDGTTQGDEKQYWTDATVAKLCKGLLAAWDALKEVEWGSTSLARQAGEKITINHCPGCAGIHPDFEPIDDMEHDDFGHAPDCKLAAALPEE